MESKSRKVGGSAGNRGMGRKKGVPNKVTGAVKDMVLQALTNKGGVKYLEAQAEANPVAFMTLVGKVIPLQVAGDAESPLNVLHTIKREITDPNA